MQKADSRSWDKVSETFGLALKVSKLLDKWSNKTDADISKAVD